MINNNLIDDRVRFYINNLDSIASKPLREKFINSAFQETKEGQKYVYNFAEVSLVVDDVIKKSKTDITDEHKELVTECIFSSYEYLSKNHSYLYKDFDEFINSLPKKLKSLKFEELPNNEYQKYGIHKNGNIKLKKNLDRLDDNYDFIFANVFTHEFCHSLSNRRLTTGLIYRGVIAKDFRYILTKKFYLDEAQTEYMATKILEENFGDNTLYKFNLSIKDGEKISPMTIETRGFNYKEGAYIGATLNAMFDLEYRYFKDGESISPLLKKKFYKGQVGKVFEKYKNLVDNVDNYGTETQTFNKKDLDALNITLENLVLNYCDEENVSDSKYLEVTSKMLNNKIYIEDDISENEISVIKMDFEYFKGEKFSREDILNIIRDESYIENEFIREKAKERKNLNKDLDKELEQNVIEVILPKTKEGDMKIEGFEL